MGNTDESLQIEYDAATRTATIVMGCRTAVVPFPVYSHREADIMGREVARNLCWTNPRPSTRPNEKEITGG